MMLGNGTHTRYATEEFLPLSPPTASGSVTVKTGLAKGKVGQGVGSSSLLLLLLLILMLKRLEDRISSAEGIPSKFKPVSCSQIIYDPFALSTSSVPEPWRPLPARSLPEHSGSVRCETI